MAGFRFPPENIVLAVRRYLRYASPVEMSKGLLDERGIEVDHVTVHPESADAKRRAVLQRSFGSSKRA